MLFSVSSVAVWLSPRKSRRAAISSRPVESRSFGRFTLQVIVASHKIPTPGGAGEPTRGSVTCAPRPPRRMAHLPSHERREQTLDLVASRRVLGVERDGVVFRLQPRELALGELARGVDAAQHELVAVELAVEVLPGLAVADRPHRGMIGRESRALAQRADLLDQPAVDHRAETVR